jgi:hypothetical protein
MDGSSDETRPWRANSALAVASYSIRVRKPPSRPTAPQLPANANDDGAGSRCVGSPIPNTNQSRAQGSWAERHPDYWRAYRGTHPEYCERNRALQRERDARRGERVLAKMAVSTRGPPVPSGTYRLSPVMREDLAKMDAWTVQITVISKQYEPSGPSCKERT